MSLANARKRSMINIQLQLTRWTNDAEWNKMKTFEICWSLEKLYETEKWVHTEFLSVRYIPLTRTLLLGSSLLHAQLHQETAEYLGGEAPLEDKAFWQIISCNIVQL